MSQQLLKSSKSRQNKPDARMSLFASVEPAPDAPQIAPGLSPEKLETTSIVSIPAETRSVAPSSFSEGAELAVPVMATVAESLTGQARSRDGNPPNTDVVVTDRDGDVAQTCIADLTLHKSDAADGDIGAGPIIVTIEITNAVPARLTDPAEGVLAAMQAVVTDVKPDSSNYFLSEPIRLDITSFFNKVVVK